MTYQVLARKWRPKDFASLVGQEHVVKALTHALDGGRLHHAYLFTGTRGVGKTTLSRIFAKALNCETGVTSKPCGVCRACREIDEGRFVDYIEMDAASNRGVDEMAALLERAVYAPVDARFKVYMIDEVHMLTNHAFNAMLKTLEEPPPHVKFILATTDPQKIPVTVLSRCLQFNLKQMPAGAIVSHLDHVLEQERIPAEPQALRLLARAAQGSMRDALSLTDQAIAYSANHVTEEAVSGMLGTLDQTYMTRLLDAVAQGDGPAVLAIADEMSLRSLSFSTALQDLAGLLHRIAWAQFAPGSVLDEWPEAGDLRHFAQTLSPEQVQLYYQIATVGRGELGLAPDEYAGFTMTLLRMLAFEPGTSGSAAGGERAVPPRTAGAQRSPAGALAAPASAVAATSTSAVAAPAAAAAAAAPAPAPTAARTDSVELAPGAAPLKRSRAATETPPEPSFQAAEAVAPAAQPAGSAAAPAAASIAATQAIPPAAAEVPAAPRDAEPRRAPPARAGGAAAALDVLRNAGMRVSPDRGRGGGTPAAARPQAAAPSQSPAPRVSAPRPSANAAPPVAAPAAAKKYPGAPAPWDEPPPDDGYPPVSAYELNEPPPDDHFAPAYADGFDAPFEPPRAAPKAAAAAPVPETRPLPPAIPLDPLGYAGEWAMLAASLPLTGIAQQLACNSELTALDGRCLKLAVPVKMYADGPQLEKLKAALAEALGQAVELDVTIGPARRTAAALEAAARAQRQREAEHEIDADPFVQQLIREFDARVVEGSVRPLPAQAERGGASEARPH